MTFKQRGYFSILNNRRALAEAECEAGGGGEAGLLRDAGAQRSERFGRCVPPRLPGHRPPRRTELGCALALWGRCCGADVVGSRRAKDTETK